MGAVFEAHDPTLHRLVALKVVLPDKADIDEFRQRFEREAQMLARVHSRHIVHIHDVGEQDNSLYLVTELIPDGDLFTWLSKRGAMSPSQALRLVAQLSEGLADAHKAGVFHRDVKPRNVLLWDRDGELIGYLCDFGIAVDETPGLTKTGTLVGSPEYMAPERHLGEPATARGDVYSLGCVLWACLTGAPPYSGTDYQVMNAHLNEPLPALRIGRGEAANRELESLLERMLEKEPRNRPAGAADLGREALRIAERLEAGPRSSSDDVTGVAHTTAKRNAGDVGPTPPTRVPETIVGQPGPGFLTANFEPSGARPTRNRPAGRFLLVGLVVALSLIAIVLGGVVIARSGSNSSPRATAGTAASGTPTPDLSKSDAPASQSDNNQVSDGFICWDSRQVDSPDQCKEPHGFRGMTWIFPGTTGQNCRPKLADSTPGRLELMTCYLDNRTIQLNFSRWSSTQAGIDHYSDQENLGEPATEPDGSLYGWSGVSSRPGYPYKGAYLWTRHSISVSVYATTPSGLTETLGSPITQPVSDDRYYG